MTLAAEIKQKALACGFDIAGIASAKDPAFASAIERYARWLDSGFDASMNYLRRHQDLKAHPENLLAGWKSVICVGLLYGENSSADDAAKAQVSLYTRGEDYHDVLTRKLEVLAGELKSTFGIVSRPFVDSEPVLERFWAWRAGLGWLGKNSMLINRKLGSYLFLGGLLTTAELEPDAPDLDHCGRCRKCIEACPTEAITEARSVDSNKCIAYHTIENRGSVPEAVMQHSGRWIAGCDICQQVCPWNDPVIAGNSFSNTNPAYNAPLTELARWTFEEFKVNTQGSAMSRIKYAGFLRNLVIAIANSNLNSANKEEAFDHIRLKIFVIPNSPGRDGLQNALVWALARP